MNKNNDQDLCKLCRLPKQSDKVASLTQWILVCTCGEVAPKDQTETVACNICGKTKRQNIKGSLTQWILKTDTCRCDIPFAVSDVSETPVNEAIVLEEEVPELTVDDFPSKRFKPISVIGKGASSRVYLCEDRLLKKHVAVKCLNQLTEAMTVNFQKEARLTTELNHPNIATLLDFGTTDKSTPYIVLEYVAGVDLSTCIDQEWPLEENAFIEIVKQILAGLEHAHGKNILHHDLKPENIIVSKDNEGLVVKIIDFGASIKHSSEAKDSPEEIRGTPLYMAPDQFRGESYDVQSEIYSFGCILFEMLTQRPPFEGDSSLSVMKKHASEATPAIDLNSLPYRHIDEYAQIANKCLGKSKIDRFRSFSEITEKLKSLNEQPGPEPSKEETSTTTKNKLYMIPVVLGCFLVLFLSMYTAKRVITPAKSTRVSPKTPDKLFELSRDKTYHLPVKKEEFTDEHLRFAKSNIEKLSLSGTSIDGSGLKYLSKNGVNLKYLKLNDTFISDKNLRYLKGMNSLEKLNLSITKVSDKGLRYMGELPLTELYLLDASKTTDEAIAIIADQFPKIQKLTFGNARTTSKSLDSLKELKNLTSLVLLGCGVTDENIESLNELKLNSLVLTGCNELTDNGLLKLKNNNHLKRLELEDCLRTTSHGVERLKYVRPDLRIERRVTIPLPGDEKSNNPKRIKLKSELFTENIDQYLAPVNLAGFKDDYIKFVPPKTRMLSFAFTQINGDGLKYLAKNKIPVTHLKLNGTFVTDESLKHLRNLKTLKYLTLSGTQISDQGLKNLGNLKLNNLYILGTTGVTDHAVEIIVTQFPSLKKMSFGSVKTTTNSILMMKDMKQLVKLSLFKSGLDDNNIIKFNQLDLKELHLIECNELTDAGLIKLKQMRGLKRLILEDMKSITPKGILSLRKLRPQLKIQVATTKSDFEF